MKGPVAAETDAFFNGHDFLLRGGAQRYYGNNGVCVFFYRDAFLPASVWPLLLLLLLLLFPSENRHISLTALGGGERRGIEDIFGALRGEGRGGRGFKSRSERLKLPQFFTN
jgi:hypothetical protein